MTETPKSLSFYLRHVLNPDCVLEVFQYLSMIDLMQMCELDTDDDAYFTHLIRERVIGSMLMDFRPRNEKQTVWYLTKTLQTFGAYIKRLSIPMRPSHFNHVLRQIITYCSPNTIKEIQFKSIFHGLDYRDYEMLSAREIEQLQIDQQLVQDVKPFFECVEKLVVQGGFTNLPNLFAIFLNSSHLKVLQVIMYKSIRDDIEPILDLITVDTLNLTKLHLAESGELFDGLDVFIRKLPHLEEFIWEGDQNGEKVGRALVETCPKLRVYGDYSNNDGKNPNYYDFLEHFNQLTEVVVSSKLDDASDIKSVLEMLARKKLLEKLTVHKCSFKINGTTELVPGFHYVDGFSCLQNIAFQFPINSGYFDVKKYLQFFHNIMDGMQELRKITLFGEMKTFNTAKLIPYAPGVKQIDIHRLETLHQMPVEVRCIRRTIQQIIEQRDEPNKIQLNADKIRLIVKPCQAREFKVLKNIDKFIELITREPPKKLSVMSFR